MYLRSGQCQRHRYGDASAAAAQVQCGGRLNGPQRINDTLGQQLGFRPGNQHPFVHKESVAQKALLMRQVLQGGALKPPVPQCGKGLQGAFTQLRVGVQPQVQRRLTGQMGKQKRAVPGGVWNPGRMEQRGSLADQLAGGHAWGSAAGNT